MQAMKAAILTSLAVALPCAAVVEEHVSETELASQMGHILRDSIVYNLRVMDEVERDMPNARINRKMEEERNRILDKTNAFLQCLVARNLSPEALPEYKEHMSRYRRSNLVLMDHIARLRNNDIDDKETQSEKLFLFRQTFVTPELLHADTEKRMNSLTESMSRLLAQLALVLKGISSPRDAEASGNIINGISAEYETIIMETGVYMADDPQGAARALPAMKAAYTESYAPIQKEINRLKGVDCYGNERLESTVQTLLHITPETEEP